VQPPGVAELVARVVKVEGPVHRDIVVQRVRSSFGLKRAGKNVEAAVEAGVEAAIRAGKVKRTGVFLWPPSPPKVLVRRRGDEVQPAIEYICDEEIAAAAVLVLRTQFATDRDELAAQALRVLGFGRAKSETKNRVLGVIDGLVDRGVAVQQIDGLIDLDESARSAGGNGRVPSVDSEGQATLHLPPPLNFTIPFATIRVTACQ